MTLAVASDAGFEPYRRRTRRDEFLQMMDRIIPWAELCAVVQPHYAKGLGGRPPIGLERMLRMLFVQHWFNLADEACEDALYDMPSLCHFVGIDLGRERAPDGTTLLKFRRLLEDKDLGKHLFAKVGEVLQDSDLSKVIDIVEKRVLEEDYTTLDLAAALLKMMMGEEGEELLEENRPLRELEDLEDESRRSRGGRNGRGSRGRNEDVARLFINIGKKDRVKPGDILGAIAGESGMPGKLVGAIDMYDKYTFVEVPREYARDVLNAMNHTKIKGKSVAVEPANQK